MSENIEKNNDLLVSAAFFTAGIRKVSMEKLQVACENGGYGHLEFVSEMVSHAPFAVAFSYEAAGVVGDNYPGVFAYEVSEPFGTFFAEKVIANGADLPSKAECENWLVDQIIYFFSQGASPQLIKKLKSLAACKDAGNH